LDDIAVSGGDNIPAVVASRLGDPVSLTKVALTSSEVEALAAAAFGNTARVVACRPAQEGMYNAAYHLDLAGAGPARAFLKVAPPDGLEVLTYERNLLRTEIQVLRALGEAGVAAVPAVLAQDLSRRVIDRDCLFMQALDGESLSGVRDRLDEADRLSLRRQIGAIAGAFAGVAGPVFGYPGNPDLQAPTWALAFRRIVAALLDDAKRFGCALPVPADELAALFDRAMPDFGDIGAARLVHYDLWDGNVLVRQDGDGWSVTGVIDWERAFYGDPLAEVVSLCLFEGAGERAALLESLAQAGGGAAADAEAGRRLALYRAYLWLIMIVEAVPRGLTGAILRADSPVARRLLRDLAVAADGQA
jgi:aminoglycoside phosphotransferase (APT) family kinase protein